MEVFEVSGTFHLEIIVANSEGEARKSFHLKHDGESIINVFKI